MFKFSILGRIDVRTDRMTRSEYRKDSIFLDSFLFVASEILRHNIRHGRRNKNNNRIVNSELWSNLPNMNYYHFILFKPYSHA